MYTKKNWGHGERITAEALNNMENGIFECDRTNASAWQKLNELEDTTNAASTQVTEQTKKINEINGKIDGLITTVDTFAYNRGILIQRIASVDADGIGYTNRIYPVTGGRVRHIGNASATPVASYDEKTGEITIKVSGGYVAFAGADVYANRAVLMLDGYSPIASMQMGTNTNSAIYESFSGFWVTDPVSNEKFKFEVALQAGKVQKDAMATDIWLMLIKIA
jgi:hypothetical protein